MIIQGVKNYLSFNKSKIFLALKTFSFTAIVLATFIWVFQEILFNQVGAPVEVWNSEPAPWTILFGTVYFSFTLIIFSPKRSVAFFLGVFVGAVATNILWRIFVGPVPDYIYVPLTGDLYCNLADLFIFFIPLFLIFSLRDILKYLFLNKL